MKAISNDVLKQNGSTDLSTHTIDILIRIFNLIKLPFLVPKTI